MRNNSSLYRYGVYSLFHATHIENLSSILNDGIYSRNRLIEMRKSFSDVSNQNIQKRRGNWGLHSYVPLLLNPTCPFIRRVVYENPGNIVVLSVNPAIASKPESKFSLNNASSYDSILIDIKDKEKMSAVDWKRIFKKYHGNTDEKKLVCSEVLIKDHIPFEYIDYIIIPSSLKKLLFSSLEKKWKNRIIVNDDILLPPSKPSNRVSI